MFYFLTITNLSKSFGDVRVLDNITYTFRAGFLYLIIGVSGSGKSTLLHLISGILDFDFGTIKYKNKYVTRSDVTPILQTAYLFGDLSVRQNILLPSLLKRQNNRTIIDKLTKLFKIDHISKRQIKYCSGGERARTNLVRGLVSSTPIVVIDEPTAHVDFATAKLIAQNISELAKSRIIVVTSHQPQLFNFANIKKLYLTNGKLSENIL